MIIHTLQLSQGRQLLLTRTEVVSAALDPSKYYQVNEPHWTLTVNVAGFIAVKLAIKFLYIEELKPVIILYRSAFTTTTSHGMMARHYYRCKWSCLLLILFGPIREKEI